jgi:hypothetical protein
MALKLQDCVEKAYQIEHNQVWKQKMVVDPLCGSS